MKRLLFIVFAAIAVLLLASCQEERPGNVYGEGTIQVGSMSGKWIYISLREGNVTGTCPIADTVSQKYWAARKDWDLAIGEGQIRTNSGISGVGSGGSCCVQAPFDSLSSLRGLPCEPDSVLIEIW